MMITKFKIALAFIFFAVLIQACSNGKGTNNIQNEGVLHESFLSAVLTAKAVLSNQEEELTLTGKVETDPDKEIRFISLISGVIDKTYFSLGDKVQKGQVLMEIRSTELSALESELISVEGELAVVEREWKAVQDMYHDHMLSEKEFLEVQTRLRQTQAALNKIRADIAVFGTSKGNGKFSIRAPMTGYVTQKNASAGGTVSADGEALFTIADLSTVWVTANVYASNLLFVQEGMEANVTTLSYPDEVFSGKINSMSQVFDPEDKALKARIVLGNDNLKLKPEMSAVIKLKNENSHKLVAIPSEALIFDNDRYFVVVEEKPEYFKIKEVALQSRNANTTYILSGLEEDENVVIKNQLLIYTQLLESDESCINL